MDECKPLVMGFFTTVVYLRAGTLTAQLEAGALTGLAIPTLGAVGWAAEHGHRLLWFTDGDSIYGRGLHSSTLQLNLSRFCHNIHPYHPLIPPNTS